MTAEQWLADLEAKAAEASLAEKQGLVCGWWPWCGGWEISLKRCNKARA